MIAIVTSAPHERIAFVNLCENRDWVVLGYDSVRAVLRAIRRAPPRVLLVRNKLEDGYSDDVIAAATQLNLNNTKIVVLMAAGTSPAAEARQLRIGADCVQRDPVRVEVLLAYLAKYVSMPGASVAQTVLPQSQLISFSGGVLNLLERTLRHRSRTTLLTPREVALIELLVHRPGEVVTYEMLYGEILGRQFRGDTSNMRVLLGKLNASAQSVGISLRLWLSVIPKSGYRYTERG